MANRNLLDRNRADSYLNARRRAADLQRETERLKSKSWGANLACVSASLAASAADTADLIEATTPSWTRYLFEVNP